MCVREKERRGEEIRERTKKEKIERQRESAHGRDRKRYQ